MVGFSGWIQWLDSAGMTMATGRRYAQQSRISPGPRMVKARMDQLKHRQLFKNTWSYGVYL
jgi:hypothetical protein